MDSSAIVKLVVEEDESAALLHALRDWPERASSELARVEVMRAVNRVAPARLPRARRLLGDIVLLAPRSELQEAAALLAPHELRSLDAIHLATARSLGDALGTLITYDTRMAQAAGASGISVAAPA